MEMKNMIKDYFINKIERAVEKAIENGKLGAMSVLYIF